jgi:hypothetical protein
MRGAVPGTKHSTILDRQEPAIFLALRQTRGVKKIEPSRIVWTGPSPSRLRLRAGVFSGVLEGWLYIGAGKRLCLLCPEPWIEIEELKRNLTMTLTRFGIYVEFIGGAIMEGQSRDNSLPVLTTEEGWAWCEVIYEGVKKAKALEEDECLLEAQLEETRGQKKLVKGETLEVLTQVLGVRKVERAAA